MLATNGYDECLCKLNLEGIGANPVADQLAASNVQRSTRSLSDIILS